MKKTLTVWLDVTDFLAWSGHLTGVQRVVYEYATRLNADDRINARFMKYNTLRNRIEEVAYSDVFGVLTSGGAITGSTVQKASLKSRLKQKALRVYGIMPAKLQALVTQRLKHAAKTVALRGIGAAHRTLHVIRKGKSMLEREARVSAAEVGAGDTVLIVGKLWDYPKYTELLADLKKNIGFRYVQVVHDIIPVYEKHLFGQGLFEPFTEFLYSAVENADDIACISDSTARDVRRFIDELHFQSPRIHRIQLGDTPEIPGGSQRPDFVDSGEKFILSVGTVEARKNHPLMYAAYKLAAEKKVKLPRLIVVGSRGWLTENVVYMTTNDPDTNKLVTFHSNVPDDQLKWLYENCLFTVYPSVYEGWGLPVRESFAYGKYCITTKRSSLAEAGSTYAGYVSGYDSFEFMSKISDTVGNLEKLTKKVRHYKPYTWDDSYVSLAKVLYK